MQVLHSQGSDFGYSVSSLAPLLPNWENEDSLNITAMVKMPILNL
jgi:hypothetical protein